MNGKRLLTICGAAFSLVGALLLAVGIFAYVSDAQKYAAGEKVNAQITQIVPGGYSRDGHVDHEVYVQYEYKGKQYSDVRLSYYDSSMYSGEQLELLVDPDRPRDVTTPGGMLFVLLVCGGMGVIFLAVGLSVLIIPRRRRKRVEAG